MNAQSRHSEAESDEADNPALYISALSLAILSPNPARASLEHCVEEIPLPQAINKKACKVNNVGGGGILILSLKEIACKIKIFMQR
jgi:hypothetical protein